MNFLKTYNFIFIFLYVGLCLPSTSQSNSDSNYQQAREKIIVRTMTDLQREEEVRKGKDKQPVLVLEKNIEEIPLQNVAVEIDDSKNDNVYVSRKIQEDVASHILKPRFEANWRYSDDRSILMGEFWLPLMQCEKESVLFCDIRLMGDDNENKEFNIGVGYREVLEDTILGDGVAGAMLWFDRRFTNRDFQFNQVTVGGEWLGEQYDLRMNGYFPIDKKKSYLQSNPNGSGEGFVGSQILVNTDQVVVEEVLPGIDFEVGSQLNFMNGITDSTRFFVGGYHFDGEIAEDITGVRTRIVSDITSDVQVGARFQHDDVRGSQTYVESTIRFPFGHKKKYKHEGYWSRLDESPERDIDVVSNEVVTVEGRNESLLNATTGLKQNVIHVDNTAAGGGDGSFETPYNTLAAAEGVATTNDMIYVHKGDGTTTNQNVGITLDDAGQMLAGSGTDLLYNTDRFKTSNGNNVIGALVESTTAPMITNGAGNGVDITADGVFVSGLTVDGATTNGIYALNADNVIIDNVTSTNNTSTGIRVDANATTLSQVQLTNNTADTNGIYGLYVRSTGGGEITKATFTNNTADTNLNTGFFAYADNGIIGDVNFTGNVATTNTGYGITLWSNGATGAVTSANFTNNTSNSNTISGLYARAVGGGDVQTVNYTNNTASNNTSDGLHAVADGAGSTITTLNFTSNTVDTNGGMGLNAFASNAADITTVNFTNNSANSNTIYGLYAYALGGSDIGTVNSIGNTATNNTSHGIVSRADGAGSTITTANFTNNTSKSNGQSALLAYAVSGGEITEASFINNTANLNSNTGLFAYADNGIIGDVNFTDNVATTNTGYGITVWSNGATGSVTSASFTNNTSNSNTISGLYVRSVGSGDVGTVNLTSNTSSNNASNGFNVLAQTSSAVGTVNFTSNTAEGNTASGFLLQANGAGSTVTTLDFTNNTASSNTLDGFNISTVTDGDIAQTNLQNNVSTNNSRYGIIINDDSAAGGIAADFGGGAFGSTGGNSVSGNTNEEIVVDLDGGALKAENNWWGSASGLTGGETLLQDASTVDATPFLTSDPK